MDDHLSKPETAKLVRRLLELHLQLTRWVDRIEDTGVALNEPISGDYHLLHLAFDLLGVPPAAGVDTPATNQRDYLAGLFTDTVHDQGTIEQFLLQVTEATEPLRKN